MPIRTHIRPPITWSGLSYNGSKFVILSVRPGNTAGMYSDGRYTPVPWPANVVDAAWQAS
jgi:hypothetical protein